MYYFIFISSEIYSLHTGEPLAKHFSQPQCTCPRQYTDSFGFKTANRELRDDGKCYKLFPGTSTVSRYDGISHGIWDIFSETAWISSITEMAEITIKMPPSVLVSMKLL